MAPIRVMLVDDHYRVRVGLANVLGFEPDIEVCGLSGMRERARALGTRLELESAPGRGTTVRVRWTTTTITGEERCPSPLLSDTSPSR